MYWWAARTLARAGYLVLTWDVQGQGESETTPHAPGQVLPFVDPDSEQGYTDDGVPFQQAYNFHEGTVDALRFLMSTPDDPYVPGSWTEDDLAAAHAAHDPGSEPIDWVNPLWAAFDREHIGLAGHSLGAGAVSNVQQCSDASTRWQEIVDLCTRSFPIRAVIGWDRLQGGDHVPVVPGMDQQADGYFLNTAPSFQARPPSSSAAGSTAAPSPPGEPPASTPTRSRCEVASTASGPRCPTSSAPPATAPTWPTTTRSPGWTATCTRTRPGRQTPSSASGRRRSRRPGSSSPDRCCRGGPT